MHRKLITSIVVFISCASLLHAIESPINRADLIKSSADITTTAYPNADIVVADEYINTTYQTNGTFICYDDEYIKILTEKGKRDYQSISQFYTIPYNTSSVVRLEIIRPGGVIIPVDTTANSRVMVNPSQMSANIYNPNSKIIRTSIPGIQIGDVLHITTLDNTTKPRVPGTWSDYRVLEHTAPIRHMSIEVDAPQKLPLTNIRLRDRVANTVTNFAPQTVGDRIIYRWEVKNVPRMFPEPKMPALYTVVQRLLLSTIPDWQTISRWYWNLSKPHLEAVTPAMRDQVKSLTAGLTNRTDKIRAIFRFVSQQIRYMGITTETTAPGYEPHDVSLTFNNRYGVCRDKAALLVAMLRMADIKAYPTLINAGPRKDAAVPQPYFNHAIVAVSNDDGTYTLLDPTDEHTTRLMPAYLSFMSYLVARPEGEKLLTSPVVPASENMLIINTRGKLTAEGLLSMTSKIDFRGINDNAYRGSLARMKPEERRRLFEAKLKRVIAGAKLTNFRIEPENMLDTSRPLSVSMSYEATRYPIAGSGNTILNLPWIGKNLGYANFLLGETGLNKRKYPYNIQVTAGIRESISIDLNDFPYSDATLPTPTNLTAAGLNYTRHTAISNRTLSCQSEFTINKVEFSPTEYLQLKQFLKDREYEQRKNIILTTPPLSDADNDIRVLSDETSIQLRDISHWTQTRSVRKKILTYAGKKSNSELKLSYNPAWESIKVISATVKNPDGTLHKVVSDEMNLMDAPWVGSAPRYPPERTLVISLPGVEVGSIISYTIERKISGKEFFSLIKIFQGANPVDVAKVTLDIPRDIKLANCLSDRGNCLAATNGSPTSLTYNWTARNLKAVKPESSLPPGWFYLPTLFVSTGNWQTYAATLAQHLEEATTRNINSTAKARQLTENLDTPRAKIKAIRDFVASNIRSAGPSLADLPLSAISGADITLAEGYGNTTDRAILLTAMLRGIGIKTDFIVASSWASRLDKLTRPFETMPYRPLFNTVLVRVRNGSNTYYLNDTDQYAELGTTSFDGRLAMDMSGNISRINISQQLRDRAEINFAIRLNANGDAEIATTRNYFGMNFATYNRFYSELPPEERRRHYLDLTASLSQAAVALDDLATDFAQYPGSRSFAVKVPRFAVRSGNYLCLTLPRGMSTVFQLDSEHRTNPLYVPAPNNSEVSYSIELPPNTESISILPPDIDWTGPAGIGSIHISHKISDNGQQLSITKKINMKPSIVSTEEYPVLLDINRKLMHPDLRTVLIKLK